MQNGTLSMSPSEILQEGEFWFRPCYGVSDLNSAGEPVIGGGKAGRLTYVGGKAGTPMSQCEPDGSRGFQNQGICRGFLIPNPTIRALSISRRGVGDEF
jgi:hypothetical protein